MRHQLPLQTNPHSQTRANENRLTSDPEVIAAVASIPAALKSDFRPPRKNTSSPSSLRDLTNFSSSQPSSTKSLSNLVPPRVTPSPQSHRNSASQANRARILDQYASSGYVDQTRVTPQLSWRSKHISKEIVIHDDDDDDKDHRNDQPQHYDVDEDEKAFSYQDAAIELEMEQAEMELDESTAGGDTFTPLLRKPRANFLSRSSRATKSAPTVDSVASMAWGPTASSNSTPTDQRYRNTACVPLAFSSPPPDLTPSPPVAQSQANPKPTPTRAPIIRTTSKYFATDATKLSPPKIIHSNSAPAQIPDATAFLFETNTVSQSTESHHRVITVGSRTNHAAFTRVGDDDDDDGRIEVDDDDFASSDGIDEPPFRSRRGVKRLSSSSTSSDAKRFRSPFVTQTNRLTLTTSSSSTASTASILAPLFTPVRGSSSSQSPYDSSSPADSSTPSPDLVEQMRHTSLPTSQPFKPLTIHRRTTEDGHHNSFNARPPNFPSSSSRVFHSLDLPFSSPPSDLSMSVTPPSPTPSPINDPEPSPSSSPSPTPSSSPSLSTALPFAVPYAVSGFDSQPSDDDEIDADRPYAEDRVSFRSSAPTAALTC